MSFVRNFFFGSKEEDPTGLSSGCPPQDNAPDPLVEGIFYPRTLYKFNGNDDERIFIAIKGRVYDCTNGRSFYGPSGPYSNFAGKDASRGLATNSFDESMVRDWDQPIDDLEGFTDKQETALNQWLDFFDKKYPCIGTLEPEPGVNIPEGERQVDEEEEEEEEEGEEDDDENEEEEEDDDEEEELFGEESTGEESSGEELSGEERQEEN